MSGMWGERARQHWQQHRPKRYASLEDPDGYFADLDRQAAARYVEIRDAQLDGVWPDDGTGWAAFLDEVARADQVARDEVEAELVYLPGDDEAKEAS